MMMAGSIEGRMPFMDVELAGVVARFPDHFLIGAKGGKAVLRASMEKLLPPRILHRKKVGFRVPFGRWVRGPYRDFAHDMLDSEASQLARICSQAKLRSLLSEHVEGLAEPRADSLVADQSRDLPAGVQAFAGRGAGWRLLSGKQGDRHHRRRVEHTFEKNLIGRNANTERRRYPAEI